jgi:glycerol kinase
MKSLLLALDQGTSSSRAIVFDGEGRALAAAQRPFDQLFPRDGWVEHDPEVLWSTSVDACREALAACGRPAEVAAMGITNQRETVLLWERAGGRPLGNAIAWQDRRTEPACARMRGDGIEAWLRQRTGLVVDPYFSATKLAWLLDHVPGARTRAERGELAAGTVDSFLAYRLSGGRRHVTDATNASRTQLYDLATGDWSTPLLEYFRVPRALLPEIVDSAGALAEVQADVLGVALPITGMAGDQQAALAGQACLRPGMTKATYGTGCFAMTHTGAAPVQSRNRLLATVAWRLGGRCEFALEGSLFVAGAAIQWLRDRLGVITSAAATEEIAVTRAGDARGVVLVPAFTGLGAPHWDAGARASVSGLSLHSDAGDIVVAALQAVAFQTHDLLAAAAADGARVAALRVDGGMAANAWLCQFIADVLDVPVARPAFTEATALGAAMLAATGAGITGSLDAAAGWWRQERVFAPSMPAARRAQLLAGWRAALQRTRQAR